MGLIGSKDDDPNPKPEEAGGESAGKPWTQMAQARRAPTTTCKQKSTEGWEIHFPTSVLVRIPWSEPLYGSQEDAASRAASALLYRVRPNCDAPLSAISVDSRTRISHAEGRRYMVVGGWLRRLTLAADTHLDLFAQAKFLSAREMYILLRVSSRGAGCQDQKDARVKAMVAGAFCMRESREHYICGTFRNRSLEVLAKIC